MDKVNDFLINQNLRIQRLRQRLNIEKTKTPEETEDDQKTLKKKEAINKNLTYIFLIAAVLILVFISALNSFTIKVPEIEIQNIFNGGTASDPFEFVKL